MYSASSVHGLGRMCSQNREIFTAKLNSSFLGPASTLRPVSGRLPSPTMATQQGQRAAIVTGGGNGIGRVYATTLAGDGAFVAVPDVDVSSAEATAASIRDAGGAAQA